jgi:hypothetical protein
MEPQSEIKKSTNNTKNKVPEYSVKNPPTAVPDSNKAQMGRWHGQVIRARKARTYPAIRRENESGCSIRVSSD